MLSLILILSCALEQPQVSCEDACGWVFVVCGEENGATVSHRLDECLSECADYPNDGADYAECLTPYVTTLPFSAETCIEPFMRGADGSDIPCASFTPCDPNEGCAP